MLVNSNSKICVNGTVYNEILYIMEKLYSPDERVPLPTKMETYLKQNTQKIIENHFSCS